LEESCDNCEKPAMLGLLKRAVDRVDAPTTVESDGEKLGILKGVSRAVRVRYQENVETLKTPDALRNASRPSAGNPTSFKLPPG